MVCFCFTAEAEESAVDPSAESAAPAPVSSEDKPKEVAAEQSPPAAKELSVEEKTDDEDLVSNKTSVESLKETNENNSNNADLKEKGLFFKFVSNTNVSHRQTHGLQDTVVNLQ